jgi:hypothetical protein
VILVTDPENTLIGAVESEEDAKKLIFQYACAYALRDIGKGAPEEIVEIFVERVKDMIVGVDLEQVAAYADAAGAIPALAKALRTFSSGCKLEKVG